MCNLLQRVASRSLDILWRASVAAASQAACGSRNVLRAQHALHPPASRIVFASRLHVPRGVARPRAVAVRLGCQRRWRRRCRRPRRGAERLGSVREVLPRRHRRRWRCHRRGHGGGPELMGHGLPAGHGDQPRGRPAVRRQHGHDHGHAPRWRDRGSDRRPARAQGDRRRREHGDRGGAFVRAGGLDGPEAADAGDRQRRVEP